MTTFAPHPVPSTPTALRRPERDHPRRRRLTGGASGAFIGYELRRMLNRQNLMFAIALPAVLYVALADIGDSNPPLPGGNFSAWMMIGIAVYGAATSAVGSSAGISVERASGYLRTLRLSPVGPFAYVIIKVIASVVLAALPVLVVGGLGFVKGAVATSEVWTSSLLTAWIGSAVFAALGLGLGLSLRPEIVMHLPGVLLTALAFLGNLFIPLSGVMLTVAQYSPMYGVAAIARHSLTQGHTFTGEATPLWGAIVNVVCWFLVFVVLAARQFSRNNGRQ